MKALILMILSGLFVQDIAFKPSNEFDIKLDYQFRQRPAADNTTVYVNESRRNSTALLPYLTLNINVISLPAGETKLRIANNRDQRLISKKIEEGQTFPLVVGFTDDAKDRVTASEYTLTFLKPDRSQTNKILIVIEEDGTFLINGEKRGKF